MNKLPILILTARSTWHEKVQGIDGAVMSFVDYLYALGE